MKKIALFLFVAIIATSGCQKSNVIEYVLTDSCMTELNKKHQDQKSLLEYLVGLLEDGDNDVCNASLHGNCLRMIINNHELRKCPLHDEGFVLVSECSIPNVVKKIGERAFCGCRHLKSVKFPDSLTEIGEEAFWGCHSLKSIKIPDTVTEIGYGAFCACRHLKSVKFPDSLTEIGKEAFWGCHSLKNIKIPDSVTVIGNRAFVDCSSLKSVKIPDSVTEIGEEAFARCPLKRVYVPRNCYFAENTFPVYTKIKRY